MIRKPAVSGKFYPADASDLRKQLNSFLKETKETPKKNALAVIMPHAGYVYSGQVAAQTIASIEIKNNVILLGPNHTGLGSQLSIVSEGSWQTPLGEIKINNKIAQYLKNKCPIIKEDINAHTYEHSLEVELPFLQFLSKNDFSIVPLVLMAQDKSIYEKIAHSIYETITELNIKEQTLIVASSDMTHYESHNSVQKKDGLAIEAILNLDEDLLIKRIKEYDISMCGYAPVVTAIITAKKLGAKKAKLIKYQTSGEVSGDYDAVVGYAGITIA